MFFSIYINLALGFLISSSLGYLIFSIFSTKNKKPKARQFLRIHYYLISLSLLPLAYASIPNTEFNLPETRLFSDFSSASPLANIPKFIPNPPKVEKENQNNDWTPNISLFVILGVLFGFAIFLMNLFATRKCLRGNFVFKRIGQLTILLGPDDTPPFSFSFLKKSYIQLPSYTINDLRTFRIILAHEIEHIRRKDTAFVYIAQTIKCLFFYNPIVHMWLKRIKLEQEYGCDQFCISQRSIGRKDYADCLINIIEKNSFEKIPTGAVGFFSFNNTHELTRRINKMRVNEYKISRLKIISTAAITAITSFLFSMALASIPSQSEHTIDSVTKILDQSESRPDFPITINSHVIKQLNLLTRTVNGKKVVKKSLKNMKKYEAIIRKKISTFKYPAELLAIPLVESRYQNLKPRHNPNGAAGVWQFIQSTALKFGLHDRMDIESQTHAAMRYLGALNLQFEDWNLAVLSYNAGPRKVYQGIKKFGTTNPWTLIENGVEGDRNYLAKVTAAMLVITYPELR